MSLKLLLAIAIVVGSFFAGKRMFQGALISIFGAFPAVGLVALVYGFPIPFSGKMQGLDAVLPSMFAVVAFGERGGFLVLAVLGVAAGAIAGVLGRGNPERTNRLTVVPALSASLLCAISVAVFVKL